jgi:Tfp pilus assembly protein PilN
MIRINLLPPSASRRRRRQPVRQNVILGAMGLGWTVLLTLGYAWIAATEAEVARQRDEIAGLVAAQAAVETGESALARRQAVHKGHQDALHRLQTARRSPAALLLALAEVVTGDRDASPFAVDAGRAIALRGLQAEEGELWRVTGTARDIASLADLVRRLRQSPRVAAVAPAEYARAEDGLLEFTLAVTARD